MSAGRRRDAIVAAVLPVFAEKGLSGATTRELAEAAGVSEALLYKHFPSKQALYEAIGSQHLADRDLHPGFDRIRAMAPSTARLVLSIQFLIAHVLDRESDTFPRLMALSLLGDGALAGTVLRGVRAELETFFEDSMAAAAAAGDLADDEAARSTHFWLVQELAFAVRMFSLPGGAVVPGSRRRDALVNQAVRFALRGVGLRTGAIRRHYDPQAWRSLRARRARRRRPAGGE
jgi:AcrR family transcriptional regulator